MELGGGRYVLHEALGSGGAATVYRAWDTALQVPRAVKLLHELPTDAQLGDRRRILAEARAMARLDHPNVLRVHDIGVEGTRDYVVMDLAEGGTLADQLDAHGPLSPAQALRYGVQVLAALAAAHRAGIVHRDVKPQNVLLAKDGTALLGDFGIALVADDVSRATRTGTAMGSLAFMAPEQRLDARTVGPPADLYGLGATLYALISGRNPVDLFAAKADSARWAGLDPELVAVLSRATRYRPADRYPDAAAMAADVLALLDRAGDTALARSPEDVPEHPRGAAPPERVAAGPEAVARAVAALGELGVTASSPDVLITLASQVERDEPPAPPVVAPAPRWVGPAGLVVLALLLVGAWWLGRGGFAPSVVQEPPPTPDLSAPDPTAPGAGAPIPAEAAAPVPAAVPAAAPVVDAPAPAAAPAPEVVAPVARPRPAPAIPTGPAPLGVWSGSFDGRPATLSLGGDPASPEGRVVVRAGSSEVATPVRGSWDPATRALTLGDAIDAPDAGTYRLVLDPDLGRMHGTWSATHRAQVLPIAFTATR